MRELSIQDLTLVQGAFALPGAVAGGAAGLAAYSCCLFRFDFYKR